jgi:transcriptional regulator with XRE-family HTH domain
MTSADVNRIAMVVNVTSESHGQQFQAETSALSPSGVVAERLKEARRRRGWTAKQLAEHCAKAGATHLTVSVLANIESGRPDLNGQRRRDITVDELVALAYVLDVAPIYLLGLPTSGEKAMRVTPNRTVDDSDELLRWLRGDQALPGTDARLYYSVALERMPVPDTQQTLSEYASAILQDRAKDLVSQFHVETEKLAERAQEQFATLVADAEKALAQGASPEEMVDLLRKAGRKRR